jgi:transketolase
MSSLLNFRVVVPADVVEAAQAIEAAAMTHGPFYIRTGRPRIPVIYDDSYLFRLGKADLLRDGSDATIVANGLLVKAAVDAAATLASEGIDCRVLNMATVRPLDREALLAAARETGAIVVAEERGA